MKTMVLGAIALIGMSQQFFAAEVPEYEPGLSLGKPDRLRQISSLAIGKDDQLVVASGETVYIYAPDKEASVSHFAPGIGPISTVAIDGETIYVFSRQTREEEKQYNGRKYKLHIPIAVTCKTFSWDGQPTGELQLEGVKDAINAKVYQGNLYVADYHYDHLVHVLDAKTGKKVDTVGKNLRLCCGILDFAVDPKDGNLLVANLGAFKLERYSSKGSLLSSFGKRGSNMEDFQGCCNPVSVAVLPDDNLVVVEKDPSRVKIYTPQGKLLQPLKNLKELVKGCNQVSVATDSKGRIYLGVNAGERFVLQYVPKS